MCQGKGRVPPDCRVRLGFTTGADSGTCLGHDASS